MSGNARPWRQNVGGGDWLREDGNPVPGFPMAPPSGRVQNSPGAWRAQEAEEVSTGFADHSLQVGRPEMRSVRSD